MEMKRFSEIIREELAKRTEGKVDVREITKNNNVVVHGLCIFEEDSNITPTIYLEPYFEDYQNGRRLESICESIMEASQGHKVDMKLDFSWFEDFEQVKDKIVFKLIDFDNNDMLLGDVPHTKILDLAKVYYVPVHNSVIGDGNILIHNSHMENWGVTVKELETLAMENTVEMFPANIFTMGEIIEAMLDEEIELPPIPFELWPMYVATNSKKTFGAAVLCYSNVIKNLAEILKSDVYILPSSLHELIIVPTYMGSDKDKLREMVSQVNRTEVTPVEILSDSAYMYSLETGDITII